MKITIYELLGLIKDGKAPKKIKYGIRTFELIENTKVIKNMYVDEDGDTLFDDYWWGLNDEVEILPDEEDEFIDIEHYDLVDNDDLNWNDKMIANNFLHINEELENLVKNQKKIITALKENK